MQGTVILIVALAACCLIGIATIIRWISGFDLIELVFGHPLRTFGYLYLILISALAGTEIYAVVRSGRDHNTRMAYGLTVLIGLMTSYAVIAVGSGSLENASYSLGHTWLALSLVAAFFFGLLLHFTVLLKRVGTLIYIVLLTNLVAFSWLARLSTLDWLNWIAFAIVLGYLVGRSLVLVSGNNEELNESA